MLRIRCFGVFILAGCWAAPIPAQAQDRPTFEQRMRVLDQGYRQAFHANQVALKAVTDREIGTRLAAEMRAAEAKYVSDLFALAQAEPGSKAVPLALANIIGAREVHPEVLLAIEQLRRDWLRAPEVAAACYALNLCDDLPPRAYCATSWIEIPTGPPAAWLATGWRAA